MLNSAHLTQLQIIHPFRLNGYRPFSRCFSYMFPNFHNYLPQKQGTTVERTYIVKLEVHYLISQIVKDTEI